LNASASSRRSIRVLAAVLWATISVAYAGGDDVETMLDAIVAAQMPNGGWTFAHGAGARAEPLTVLVRGAERVLGPLGLAGWDLVVLRSPGTPAGGLVLLDGYRRTGRATYLAAARRAGDLLVAVQLASGGWFSEMPAFGTRLARWFPPLTWGTMIDDDVTPGAVRFLLALWETTGVSRYRRAAERGTALLVRAQLPGGGWPLVRRRSWMRALHTRYPDLPSVNDAATPQAIRTLLAAADALGRPKLRRLAARGGRWLVRVQGGAPQAGWAQQYDAASRPAPARRFEPAGLASWETRYALDALDALARATGDRGFCAPVAAAVSWLERSALSPGCWARLYAVGSNEPRYARPDGTLVDQPALAYPNYSWTGDFGIPAAIAHLRASSAASRPPARLVGDPGNCPGDAPHGGAKAIPDDPRALIARTAIRLEALQPWQPSPCAPAE
jgi:hypothetical protein